jgi:hypothetical protein
MWQRIWQHKQRSLKFLAGFLLLGGLSGCPELSSMAGDLYGWNCRPEALKDGRCVASR